MRIAAGNKPALPKPAKNSGHTCGLLRSLQRSDKPGPQYPQVLGLQPKFARLRLKNQIRAQRIVHHVDRTLEIGKRAQIPGRKAQTAS